MRPLLIGPGERAELDRSGYSARSGREQKCDFETSLGEELTIEIDNLWPRARARTSGVHTVSLIAGPWDVKNCMNESRACRWPCFAV